jgi:hypothetical protein
MFIWNAANNEHIEDTDPGYVPRYIRHYAKGWAYCDRPKAYYPTAVSCLNDVTLQDTTDDLNSVDY